jgi:hypothetical protein
LKQSTYAGQNWDGIVRRQSSLDQGYYSGLDDKLTFGRLVKGILFAIVFASAAYGVMHFGARAGF